MVSRKMCRTDFETRSRSGRMLRGYKTRQKRERYQDEKEHKRCE